MALFRQPGAHRRRNRQSNFFDGQLLIQFGNELVHDHFHDLQVQGIECNGFIQPVSKFGAEHSFNGLFALGLSVIVGLAESDVSCAHLSGTGI